jgi:pimeloyl-ACP methyl ester carboxylesterase
VKAEENVLPLPGQVRCPVFLAWAKDDFVLPLRRNALFFGKFRDQCPEIFKGGHAAFLEDPDAFEQSLRRFLSEKCVNRR